MVSLATKVPLSAINGQNNAPPIAKVDFDTKISMCLPSWEWGSHDDVTGQKILMD